ncbi:unnamed protein product, partial [Rotaria socialis]
MCSNCNSIQAKFWCKKCETNYCSQCYELDHGTSSLKIHISIPIDQRPVIFASCNQHPGEKLKFWCNSCRILVCSECIILQHQSHAYNKIEIEASNKTKEQQDWFMKTKSILDQLMKYTTELMTVNENPTIEKITKTFKSLRAILTKHENELKEKICTIEKRNKDLVEIFQNELRRKQEELSKRNKDFEGIISVKDYTKLLQGHQNSVNYLMMTTQELSAHKYPLTTKYRIDEIQELQRTVADTTQRVHIYEWQE